MVHVYVDSSLQILTPFSSDVYHHLEFWTAGWRVIWTKTMKEQGLVCLAVKQGVLEVHLFSSTLWFMLFIVFSSVKANDHF